jgi:hypothetical protein
MLGEPLDLDAVGQLPQLAHDGEIAVDVPESDWAADDERARRPRGHRAGQHAPSRQRHAEEALELQVDAHCVAHVDGVATGLELHELPVRPGAGQHAAHRHVGHAIVAAVHQEHRAVDAAHNLVERQAWHQPRVRDAGDQDLRRRLAGPPDRVFDRLGRVRLAEDLGHEEGEPPRSARASSARCASPSLLGGRDARKGRVVCERPLRRDRTHQHEAVDALRVAGGQPQPDGTAHREPDDVRAADRELVQQVRRVVDHPVELERRGGGGALTAADARRVIGDDTERARKSGHLQVPMQAGSDLPGRQQQ